MLLRVYMGLVVICCGFVALMCCRTGAGGHKKKRNKNKQKKSKPKKRRLSGGIFCNRLIAQIDFCCIAYNCFFLFPLKCQKKSSKNVKIKINIILKVGENNGII